MTWTRQKYSCILGESSNLIGLHPLLYVSCFVRMLHQRAMPISEFLKDVQLHSECLKIRFKCLKNIRFHESALAESEQGQKRGQAASF